MILYFKPALQMVVKRNIKIVMPCLFTRLYLLSAGTPKETNQDSYENSVHAENTYANFSYRLTTSRMNETSEDSNFRIEVKLYEAGTLRTACVCLWLSRNDPVCKILWNDSICEADTSEMHFSLLIKRTYTNITWVCFQQNYAPVVLKQRTLQVTCEWTVFA